MRVLLIDDEQFYFKLIRKTLKEADYDLEYAKSGNEGLSKVPTFEPDMVIVDLKLPEMDGFQILDRIRRDPKYGHLPVIVITAQDELSEKLKAFELGADDEASVRTALAAGDPVIVHLAEGVVESSRRELNMLIKHGFLQKGLVAIHGVALTAADFQTLQKGGGGHVWSPRSNLELYGSTADINAARAAGLTIAISPDWSPSGSAGMIPEMTYAWRWIEDVAIPLTARDLVNMATLNAATLGNVADRTGQIAPKLAADLLVVAADGRSDPYETLVETQAAGVKLVIVAGRPLYGDAALLTKVNPAAKTEPLTVCGAAKVIDMSDSDDGKGISWADTRAALTGAMGKLTPPVTLAELVDCR